MSVWSNGVLRRGQPKSRLRPWQAESSRRSRSEEAELGQRSSWQRKSAASFRKDCQEPPDADPHVRWCGSREGQPSRRPDWALCTSQMRAAFGIDSKSERLDLEAEWRLASQRNPG